MSWIDQLPAAKKEELSDVQGDILCGGFPKKHEIFCFFAITNATEFCKKLHTITPLLSRGIDVAQQRLSIQNFRSTPGQSVLPVPGSLLPIKNANIGFSIKGLQQIQGALKDNTKLSLDSLQQTDGAFFRGMFEDKDFLQDPSDTWQPAYNSSDTKIHGVILVAGSTPALSESWLRVIMGDLGATVKEVVREAGDVRQGANSGHEHFGFLDCISQPTVNGYPDEGPGVLQGKPDQLPADWNIVDPNVILVKREVQVISDTPASHRPDWMNNGSFLVFRKLEQDVGAWRDFASNTATKLGLDPTATEAQFMGRFPGGCPVVLSKTDDPTLKNANRFDFRTNDGNFSCPFGAHIRKMNPRQSINGDKQHRLIRRGIPYGSDYDTDKTDKNRGILFGCYQSRIEEGFLFIQTAWANDTNFPNSGGNSGIDPMMGQSPGDSISMNVNAADGSSVRVQETGPDGANPFVIPRGGEYFFMPAFSALTGALADAK